MTHNGKFVVPLAARATSAQERTGYIVLHPCDPYMTLVRQCGTPSCATSAQERTGYMVVMHLSWNTDKPISPLDSKMTHVRQCGTPSCATNAQERTGYSCPQLRTPAPRNAAMSWYP